MCNKCNENARNIEKCEHCGRWHGWFGNDHQGIPEEYFETDPLEGDVDRYPENFVTVSYAGPNGPEYEQVLGSEFEQVWCKVCRGDLEPGEGSMCEFCRDEE